MIRIFAWLAPSVLMHIGVKLLAGLGVAYVTFNGLQPLMDWVFNEFKGTLNGLPELFLNLAGIAKLDVVVNIYLSAVNIAMLFFVVKRFRIS